MSVPSAKLLRQGDRVWQELNVIVLLLYFLFIDVLYILVFLFQI